MGELRNFREYLKNNTGSANVDSEILKGLLSDFVKGDKKNVLRLCIDAGVVDRLSGINLDSFEERKLASKLENSYYLKPESALWVIRAWNYIFGMSDEEPMDIAPPSRPTIDSVNEETARLRKISEERERKKEKPSFLAPETIPISGVRGDMTISCERPVKLIVSGVRNVIRVPYDITVIQIVMSGVRNIIYIPHSANPGVKSSGVGNRIVRY